MNEEMLLKRIMALDFMITDLGLFLDTHPKDREAMATFEEIVKECKKVKRTYEENFAPLTMCEGVKHNYWRWVDEPWPWQNEANCKIKGVDDNVVL